MTSDDLFNVLGALADVLNERGTDYALIGGLAVAARGAVRATRDVDLVLTVPQVQLPGLFESLRERGFELDVTDCITRWNQDHVVAFTCGEVRIDWIKAVIPAFLRVLERARWEDLGGRRVRIADAEGLLLMKLIAFRPRDQEDIRGILAANPGSLDLEWIRREWTRLAGPDDERAGQFEELVREFYPPPGG